MSSDLFITSVITDQIRQSVVLLPIIKITISENGRVAMSFKKEKHFH